MSQQTAATYDFRAAPPATILAMTGWDALEASDLSLTMSPEASRFNLRGSLDFCQAICGKVNLSLPAKMLTASGDSKNAVLWIGPDEFYLFSQEANHAATLAQLSRAQDASALGKAGSLVDNSHRFIGICLDGAAAAQLMASYCPLDLSLSAFPIGKATRTLMGKSDILLWRQGEGTFQIEIARSFASYGLKLLGFAHQNQISLRHAGISG